MGAKLAENLLKNAWYLRSVAKALAETETVCVVVMELMKNGGMPQNMEDLRAYMQTLLQTLDFAHSRSVINGDLNTDNVYFDGKGAKLFDWNEGSYYEPDTVPLQYNGVRMPPEGFDKNGKVSTTAIYPTVSSFDIWSVWKLLTNVVQLNKNRVIAEDPSYALLMNMKDSMFTEDPFKRPHATELLQHEFFQIPAS